MTIPDPAAPDGVPYDYYEALGEVLAAARWALDLIEGGKEVWWCEEHLESQWSGSLCWHWEYDEKPCKMVKRLLVEP